MTARAWNSRAARKRRYHDFGPIPQADLRRDHRLATFSLLGTAFAVALALAHMAGVGL